jgi:hypothetical protein
MQRVGVGVRAPVHATAALRGCALRAVYALTLEAGGCFSTELLACAAVQGIEPQVGAVVAAAIRRVPGAGLAFLAAYLIVLTDFSALAAVRAVVLEIGALRSALVGRRWLARRARKVDAGRFFVKIAVFPLRGQLFSQLPQCSSFSLETQMPLQRMGRKNLRKASSHSCLHLPRTH